MTKQSVKESTAASTATAIAADDLDEQGLTSMSDEDFGRLPFGAVRLNAKGIITLYNAAEESLARRDHADVIGRKFFEEVAPCTNIADFRGKLDSLESTGGLTTSFDFVFKFPWGSKKVRIRLAVMGGHRWVFVTAVSAQVPRLPPL